MSNQAFALSGDYGYINQITTTVKSIFYHNHDSKIYIINKDIPQEWFNNVNNRVSQIGCQVINTHIGDGILEQEHVSQPNLNEMSYGRILIPELIPNEDRILYLDSDLVVDKPLTDLFTMDLGNHPIAAVEDLLYLDNFNSGVILFNMSVIKQTPNVVKQMLDYGLNNDLSEGDQSVLNHFFKDTYLHLPLKYNLAIGYDFLCTYYPEFDHNYFEKVGNTDGAIIHFTGPIKPWQQFSTSRFREKWWQYYDLEWSEIVHHQLPQTLSYTPHGNFLTVTNSQNLKGLETLVKALPNCTFHIAAWTNMGGGLTDFVKYPNVHLYPSAVRFIVDQLIKHADAYLDINYETKDNDHLNAFQATGKPIYSFDEVNSSIKDAVNYHSFANDDVNGMVAAIKKQLNI